MANVYTAHAMRELCMISTCKPSKKLLRILQQIQRQAANGMRYIVLALKKKHIRKLVLLGYDISTSPYQNRKRGIRRIIRW